MALLYNFWLEILDEAFHTQLCFLSHNRCFFFVNKLFLVSYCRRIVGFPSRNLQYQLKTPHGIPSFKDFSAPRLHRELMLNPVHSYRFNLPGRKGKESRGLGFFSTHNNQQSLSAMDQTLYCSFIRSLAHCYQLPLTLQLEIWQYGIWCAVRDMSQIIHITLWVHIWSECRPRLLVYQPVSVHALMNLSDPSIGVYLCKYYASFVCLSCTQARVQSTHSPPTMLGGRVCRLVFGSFESGRTYCTHFILVHCVFTVALLTGCWYFVHARTHPLIIFAVHWQLTCSLVPRQTVDLGMKLTDLLTGTVCVSLYLCLYSL